MRPACSRSRLDEFRSFLFQFGISTSLAHTPSICVVCILVDTFQSDHTLFKLYETSNDEQETLLDGTRECKGESGHRGIYAWR